jgi:hypothetical protein
LHAFLESLHRLLGDVGDGDGGAGGREPVHERAPDRAPAAGDEDSAAG